MNNNNSIDSKKIIEKIVSSSNGKIDKSVVNSAAKGDISALVGSLNEEDRKKLNSVLGDKNKTKEILSSDAAQKLMKLFLKDGKF